MPASTTDTITQGYGSIHKGRSTVRANLINHTVSSSHKNQPTVYAASPPVEPADTSSPVNFEEPPYRATLDILCKGAGLRAYTVLGVAPTGTAKSDPSVFMLAAGPVV